MIELTSAPAIERAPDGGGELVLWMGKPFDYSTPFRDGLGEIAETLGSESVASLDVPPPKQGEDFVEGSLRFQGNLVNIYWEHSLSYLSLSCDDVQVVHDIAGRLDRLLSRPSARSGSWFGGEGR